MDLLSRLHHRHVLRYYQAWLDESDEASEFDNISEQDESLSEFHLGSGFSYQNGTSKYHLNSSSHHMSYHGNHSTNRQNSGDKDKGKTTILYIQTEYCPNVIFFNILKTLRKLIDE